MSINRELEAENEVLREQNLMMNKSGVEKSARIRELEEALENIFYNLSTDPSHFEIEDAKEIAKKALEEKG